MKNKFLSKGLFLCLELYFVINIFCILIYLFAIETEKSIQIIAKLFLIQNIVFASLSGVGYYYFTKAWKNSYIAPSYSFVIMKNEGKQIKNISSQGYCSLFILKKENDVVIETIEAVDSSITNFAVLNKVEDDWYIEVLSGKYPVGLKKRNDTIVYKLKDTIPYKLSEGDIIYINTNKILVKTSKSLEE